MDYTAYIEPSFVARFNYPDLKPFDQDWRWCHKYAHDIITKKIPSCIKMQHTALRHFKDLQRDDVYFDERAADEIVRWFKFCPIVKGSKAGTAMVLDPSQIFIAASLMGWKWSDDLFEMNEEFGHEMQVRHKGKRRYNQLYAQVSRKYGKTSFIAAIHLYLMKKYKFNPRVYSLATKRDQAKEVWNVSKKMIQLSPALANFFTARANDILSKNHGEYKALSSDSNSLDGLDPIAGSLDECHAIKDPNLYGVMISAFGGNEGGEFLFSIITTAGFILNGLCVDQYNTGAAVLDPDKDIEQDNYFYAIFEIDEGDDWQEERNWFKANPALVYGRPSLQYIRSRYTAAKMSVQEKANFLTKHCNLFVNGFTRWLNMDDVKSCDVGREKLDEIISEHKAANTLCYAAIDRARVNDINSITLLFPENDGGYTLRHLNYISQTGYDQAPIELKYVYDKSIETGDLVLVKSKTLRNDYLIDEIKSLFNEYNIASFFYDPWHMREICETLAEDHGLSMVAVSQGTGNMSEPAKLFEGHISDNLVRYHSAIFDYCCSCALMGMTKKNNIEIFRDPKRWDVEKIDALISTIIALSGATLIKEDYNVYERENRGLIFL